MDWKHNISGFVLIALLSSLRGAFAQWTAQVTPTSTGVQYGLDISSVLTGVTGAAPTYFIDYDDGVIGHGQVSSTTTPDDISRLYPLFGYYNISVFLGNDDDFAFHMFLDHYVGDVITDLDVSNGSMDFLLPVLVPSTDDVILSAAMDTGTDVKINATIRSTGSEKKFMNYFNGTNFMTFERTLFPAAGIYTVEMRAYNPLTPLQLKDVIVAVTEEITVVDTVFDGYTAPYNLMKDVLFTITTTLTSGHDVTFSYTFTDRNGDIKNIVGKHCTGLVRTFAFDHTFPSNMPTGEYSLILEMSNFVGNVTQIIPFTVYYAVNNFGVSTTSIVELYTNAVTFDVTVSATGVTMGQGNVVCTATYQDGNTDDLTFDLTAASLSADTTKSYSHSYTAGIYNVSILCINGIPQVLPDPSIVTSQQFFVLIKVLNPVANIAFLHDSANPADHSFSKPIIMTISLDPTSSLPLEGITCQFDFNDASAILPEDNIRSVQGDVTATSSITTEKRFSTGDHTYSVTVNCSNELTFAVLGPTAFTVVLDCWLQSYYFDAAFKETPREQKTNEKFELSGDVKFTYTCADPYVRTWNWYSDDGTLIDSIVTESTKLVQLPDTRDPHTYKVELIVTFPNLGASMADYINVKYVLPALQCKMNAIAVTPSEGDTHAQQVAVDMTLDASTSSDPAVNLASIVPLTTSFQWTCQSGLSSDDVDLFFSGQTLTAPYTDCSNLFADGISAERHFFQPNSLTPQWYLFSMTQTKGDRSCSSSKAVNALAGEPINAEIIHITNCLGGKLTFDDLQMNVKILDHRIDNSTSKYLWSISKLDPTIDTQYVDISQDVITDKRNNSGIQVHGSVLSNKFDTAASVGTPITFRVEASITYAGFSETILKAYCNLNLKPYNGQSSLKAGNLPVDDPSVTIKASMTQMNMFWNDFMHNNINKERSSADNGGELTYCVYQIFLQDDKQENTSLVWHQIYCGPALSASFMLLGCKNAINVTRIRLEVRHSVYTSPYVFIENEIKVFDFFDDPASVTVDNVAALESSLITSLTSAAAMNNIESITGSMSSIDAFSSVVIETEEVSIDNLEPIQTEPDVTSVIGSEDAVVVYDVDQLMSNIMSEPVIDPVLAQIQSTKQEATKLFAESIEKIEASNPGSLETVSSVEGVFGTIGTMTSGGESQNTVVMLDTVVNVMSKQMEIVSGIANLESTSETDKQKIFSQVIGAVSGTAESVAISSNNGLVEMVDLGAARELADAQNDFLTPEEIEKRENSNVAQSETNYINLKKAQQASLKKEERKAMAMKAYNSAKVLTDTVMESAKIADGGVLQIQQGSMRIDVKKDKSENLAKEAIQAETTSVVIPALNSLSSTILKVMVSEMKQVLLFSDNSGAITSPMKSLRIDTTSTLQGTVNIAHKVDPPEIKVINPIIYEDDASKFSYQKVLVKETNTFMHFTFKIQSSRVKCYKVYASRPKEGSVSKLNNYESQEACAYNNYTISVSTTVTGTYSVGVETIFEADDVSTDSESSSRKRRSATNETEPQYPAFGMGMATMNCLTWNGNAWTNEGCAGQWVPNDNELQCTCQVQKVMTFANSFVVPVNKIDFSSVFLKFSPLNQAAVMGVLAGIFIIYILIILWARRQDRQDLLKWGITPLSDNFAQDNYFYVVKVSTGLRPGAGTKSKIGMVIVGDEMDTGVRELFDGVRKEFRTGSVMNFLLSTNVYLGDLEYIRIWHDNSGGGNNASWYLSKIEVQDVQRNETFVFLSERWLAIDKDDCQIECVLPVCKTENLNIFKNRFYSNAKDNLAESHMWVSVVYRPVSSNFSRVQRASCALCFIMLTMIANAMFFKSSDEDNYETPSDVQVGPFRFSLRQIYISLISAVITTPPVIILIYVFKLSKSKPGSQTQVPDSEAEQSSCYRFPSVASWLDRKRVKSRQLEKHLVEKGYPKTSGCTLPHQCRYAAWFLVFAITFLCSFFVMLYSMQWGKQKSEEWLTTFIMSFFESVFCVDPIKVAFMAIILAILFRTAQESENVIDRSTIMKKYTSQLRGSSGGMRLPAPPLDRDMLSEARDVRQRELKMRSAFRDVLINSFLMWILFSISYSQRDALSFQTHQEIVSEILDPSEIGAQKFSTITRETDFYKWMRETAIPRMFPFEDINGNALQWRLKQFTGDFAKFRVGPPRLRQLRTKKDSCSIPYIGTQPCYQKYAQHDEDTSSYCIGWKDGPCDPKEVAFKHTSDAWKFISAFDIWGFPIAGTYTTYGGGGYIAKLSVNRDVSLSIMQELFDNSWLDRQTRAVIFESTLYCINKNLFTYNIMMVEFPETGGAIPYYLILPMRLYTHIGPMGMYTLGCEVIFLLYLLVYTIIMIMGIVKEKCAFFKQPWQLLDFLFVVISYIAIIMYGIRMVMATKAMSLFNEDKKEFVNFFHIALWDQILVMMIGFLVFLITLRTLNILGYNKRISSVAKVFSGAANQLIWFGVFFFVVFTIYAVTGYLLFGSKLKSYKNVYSTMGTLFISMIGKSKFTEIEESDPVMSKIYFMIFIVSIVYIVLTMFLAILCMSIDQVHADTKTDKGDEMVDYVLNKFRGMLAYGAADGQRPVKPVAKRPPAPWTVHNQKKLAQLDNRAILQDLRQSLSAIAVNPRELKTPTDQQKPVVRFRK